MTVSKRYRRSARTARAAFSLPELLVVIVIIVLLATVAVRAYFSTMDMASTARTQAQIAKIDVLLAAKWESYRTRRVSLAASLPSPYDSIDPNDRTSYAEARLCGLRELMRIELPDRKTDVTDAAVIVHLNQQGLRTKYLAQIGDPNDWTTEHQGAECLYLILSQIGEGDGKALSFLRETEIGDLDGDNMPEILDGWGTPIRFLRWAPGFPEEWLEDSTNSDKYEPRQGVSEKQDGQTPDPFDPMGVFAQTDSDGNPVTFALYPLVISAGSDKVFDIRFNFTAPFHYNATTPPNNPYHYYLDDGKKKKFGNIMTGTDDQGEYDIPNGEDDSHDNIHSHSLQTGVRR